MTNVPFLNSVTNVLSKNDVKGLELANALMDITEGNEKLDDLLTLQSSASEIDEAANNYNNLKYIISKIGIATNKAVVGDSISHGAFSTDLKNKSYVSLLRNHFNRIFNSNSYGFETIAASNTDGIWNSTMIHGVYTVGTWTTPADADMYSLNGMEKWGVATSQMFFELDDLKNQKKFKLNLLKHITSNCTYSIYVNNVLKITESITASGTFKEATTSSLVDLVDDGNNHCIIKVVITAGEMGIFGCTYYNKVEDALLHNYSQSSRKTTNVKEEVIKQIMQQNEIVFWNLGHNDAGLPNLTQFNQVMEWVYTYATTYKTVVIFSDFLWTHNLTNLVRLKNKEISTRLGKQSWYIDIPQTLTIDGSIPTSTYLTTTIGAWSDVSHPNDKGHRGIYNAIKKELNL